MRPLDPRLLRTAAAARTFVVAAAALSVLATVCVVVQAFAIGHAVAPVALDGVDLAAVATPLAALVGAVVLRAALTWFRERLGAQAAVDVVAQLRTRLLEHTSRLPHRWRTRHGAEVTTLATRGLDDLVPYVTGYLPQLLLTAILTPLTLLVVLRLDLVSGLVVAATLPLIPVFMWLVGVTTQRWSEQRLEALAAQGSQLLDLLAGLTTLRALGREVGPGVRVRRLGEAYRTTTMQTLRVAFLSSAVLELLASLSVALVAVEIGMRLVYDRIDLATGLTVLILAPEIYQPLRQVGAQFHASTNGLTAVQRVFAVLDEPLPADGERAVPAWDRLVVSGLAVAADDRGYLAPADLDAVIEPGRVTALAGASGSGKTTTAMALLRLQPPDAGTLVLEHDGERTDLADVASAAWWAQAAWVPQRVVTSGGTVRSHALGGASGPDAEARLVQAAEATGLAHVVAGLPLGWATPLAAEAGGLSSGLSVGQTHRLELTRALVRGARLVVADEPTAHLAPGDEQEVVAALRAVADAGAAVVVVAHRPGTLTAADVVVQVRSSAPVEVAA
ncbi:thiol reductant ABC exporter subunit CydD [Miniimonas sp. S16]|uniref:thiol reductant ABC exporter subunit CydD n=1 Tax=Miniimonas sp. S16 TaxID=2171623 RepID=UPI000D526A5E|nr:thiol reductant ABC exporter subunit CydD [Miniimonas sp. S16]